MNYIYMCVSEYGEVIPVTVLLPNNTQVAKLLEAALGPQTAAVFLTSYINPLKVCTHNPKNISVMFNSFTPTDLFGMFQINAWVILF